MPRVVIFGTRDTASLAHHYLTHDSGHEVVAFAVDPAHHDGSPTFEGKPVVPFADLLAAYPPQECRMFAPMTHRGMNRPRAEVVARLAGLGYDLIGYTSSRAIVPAGFTPGPNTMILEGAIVQPFARVGANVMIWSGAHVAHHAVLEDHVFLAPRAAISGRTVIGRSSFVGINATVRDGLTLGEGTLVAMGACLTRDTEPWSIYQGHPARRQPARSDAADF